MPDKPIKPLYPNYPLSLKESEEKLTDALRQFHGSIVQAREPSKRLHPPLPHNIAIKAAAGLGKTTEAIAELCVGQIKSKQAIHIEYYVPTHNLSAQLVNDIESAYKTASERIKKTTDKPDISVSIIKGRLQTDSSGLPLCNKSEQVEQLAKLGYPVSSFLCKHELQKCEYFTTCGYQQQLQAQTVDTTKLTLPAVTVMTHHQLFLERHEFLPKPDCVVIDESFYQAGIETIEIGDEVIQLVCSTDGKPSNTLLALRDFILDSKPLLKSFRHHGVTKAELHNEAKQYKFKQISAIQPHQTSHEQSEQLKQAPKYLRFDYILRALADELYTQKRDSSYLLFYVQDRNKPTKKLVFKRRKEFNLPADIPILFIDADLNEQVIKLFREDTKIINISVERQATVHQFNQTLSQYSRDKNPEVTQQLHTFLNLFKDNDNTLIVTTKSLRKEINDENDNELKQTGQFGQAAINHYGNLRGLNNFKDFKQVVVVDRNQPNNEQLERTAKALWFDKGLNITSCANSNNKTYPRKQFALRMSDHSEQVVNASYHPDKYVNYLLEINRNAEITQAIDRLRLLRGNDKGRQVFIATSVPVDITVDYLWDWKHLHKLLGYMKKSEVIPLYAQHFLKIFPEDSVKSVRGAQDLIKNLNNTLPLIGILISNYVVFKYKHADSRKAANVLIANSVSDPKKKLEELLGVEIYTVEKVSE